MTSLAYGALWIFVFSVPWERIIVLPGVSIVTRITGALALALALFSVVTSARVRRLHRFHMAALLFVITAGVALFGIRFKDLPDKFLTYVQLLLMVWMIWEIAPSKKRLLGLMMAYVFGAYVAALDTLMLYRSGGGKIVRFAAGEADPNDHAMVLALGLPMAWYLATTYHQPILRWLFRAYLPVAAVAVGLTGSRGGMLASMVGLLIVPLTMTRLSPGRLATAIVVLGLSGAIAIAYVPDRLVQRFASTGSEMQDLRFGGRFKLWMAGLRAFTEKPVLGHGVNGFQRAIRGRLGIYTQVAHNSFLSVLVEQGLVGLLFYLCMFIAVFLAVLELPTLERRFGLVLLATLGIAMLPLTWEHRKGVWFVLAVLTGFAQVAGIRTRGAVRKQQARRPTPLRYPAGARPLDPLTAPGREATT
ncbi:MAG: O-antigen ligase family protein [Gemmatimonadales bacterium]|nr:O-antigen ligase family protein [Gemmatimonadales bacterium]